MKKNHKCSGRSGVSGIYHEKQSKELCALHALNNLFQCNSFTKQDMDTICVRLTPVESTGPLSVNPHRSVLRTGNYDVNVVMTALASRGLEAVWWDKRKRLTSINFSKVYGFILNVNPWMSWGLVTLPFKRKHWIAVKRIDDMFINLDSKLKQPEVIGQTDSAIVHFLSGQLDSKEAEMLLVVDPETAEEKSWLIATSQSQSHPSV